MKRRVAKYLLPVLTFSVLFNVPKFFEAEIEYVQKDGRHNGIDNVSFFRLFFTSTAFGTIQIIQDTFSALLCDFLTFKGLKNKYNQNQKNDAFINKLWVKILRVE